MDSNDCYSGVCGLWWTPVDTVWMPTDQKVGDSGSPGRADETPVIAGVSVIFRRCRFPVTGCRAAAGPRGFEPGRPPAVGPASFGFS